MMLEKIKRLPDKTLLMIGLTIQLIAMTFVVVVGFINEITIDGWINFIFYALYFIGLPFILLAYDKRRKNKKDEV